MGKNIVKVERLNFDVEYLMDMYTGHGFKITDGPMQKISDDECKKSINGPQSPLYGTDYGDENAFMERFRCKCGEFVGKQFRGEICPICNTPIEEKGIDIKMTGWISLKNHKVINPYYYNIIASAYGKNNMASLIDVKRVNDIDGKLRRYIPKEFGDEVNHPYSNIGVEDFYKNFDEINAYFKNKKKNKSDVFDRLSNEKNSIFTSHIPIYSTFLRPQSITSESFYYTGIDKIINPVCNLAKILDKAKDVEIPYILYSIQYRLNKLFDMNFDLINGKEGWPRGQIIGGSINNSSRGVIVCDPTLHDNEVSMSYSAFLILFKYKIIYRIMTQQHTSLSRAYNQWVNAYNRFDKSVYEIMRYVVQVDQPRIILNRNPTLNYYSLLLMRIRDVKPDKYDYTLSIPLSILPGLNADFDGDVLNMIALMHDYLIDAFSAFEPLSHMIMSRDTGLLNDYFNIEKSQLIDLYQFCTI